MKDIQYFNYKTILFYFSEMSLTRNILYYKNNFLQKIIIFLIKIDFSAISQKEKFYNISKYIYQFYIAISILSGTTDLLIEFFDFDEVNGYCNRDN